MPQEKEISPAPRPGNVSPGHELRQSLGGIDKCREFFKKFKLIEYLESVNKYYLEGKGKIVGPVHKINSDIQESELDEINSQNFDLTKSWGGLHLRLVWDEDSEGKPQKSLYFGLFYGQRYDYLQLYLQADKPNNKTESVEITKSFFRTIWINPHYINVGDVDDVLLNFTDELIKAGVV